MAIPAPVVFPVKTTLWRKLSLVVIFSAGCFIMAAAILRVDFVLAQGDSKTGAIWSCREDFVAIIVGQAPIRKFLIFQNLSLARAETPMDGAHTGRVLYGHHMLTTRTYLVRPAFTRRFWTGEMSQGSSAQRTKSSYPIQSGTDAFEMGTSRKGFGAGSANKSANRHPDYNVTIQSTHGRNSDGDSTDRIINSSGIMVDTWVDVESESVNQEAKNGPNQSYDKY